MAKTTSGQLWTIAELANQVVAAMAKNFGGVANGRVRDVPDLRAIRYYTTLGLLDRPAEMRGRTAYYQRRHLYQLVAIKRLQAQGLSLAKIQEHLLGLGDPELQKLADVKTDIRQGTSKVETVHSAAAHAPPRAAEFWKSMPVMTARPASARVDASERPEVLTLVNVAAGMSLGFEASRPLMAEDVEALRTAAEPLRQLLIQRRLISPHPEGGPYDETAPHPSA